MPEIWARLRPYNPGAGCVARRRNIKGRLYIGGDAPTWYKVDKSQADWMKTLTQDSNNRNSPPLFDVVDGDRKAVLDEEESRLRAVALGLLPRGVPGAAPPPSHVDLTTASLPPPPGRAEAVPNEPDDSPAEAPKEEKSTSRRRGPGSGRRKSATRSKKK